MENAALSVAFVSDRLMRELNNRYLERNYATDVLSFSYEGETIEGMPYMGEIVIAPEAAARYAARYRVQPDREIKKLLIHGILHLSGLDHEVDDGRMLRIQVQLMRRSFFKKAFPVLEEKKENAR